MSVIASLSSREGRNKTGPLLLRLEAFGRKIKVNLS